MSLYSWSHGQESTWKFDDVTGGSWWRGAVRPFLFSSYMYWVLFSDWRDGNVSKSNDIFRPLWTYCMHTSHGSVTANLMLRFILIYFLANILLSKWT